MPKYNLFTKIVLLIVIMLVPIMALYFYSNKTSSDVLGSELNRSNTNQLKFFQSQVNANIDLLSLWPNLLIHDPDIFSFKDIFKGMDYLNLETITLVKRIQTKLNNQESSSNWKTSLYIYSPTLKRVISENDAVKYDERKLVDRLKPGWQVKKVSAGEHEMFVFSLMTVYPYSAFRHPENANLMIEVQFDSGNIQDMLDKFKNDGRRDPIFYKKGTGVIYNRTSNRELADQIIYALAEDGTEESGNRIVTVNGKQYLVYSVDSKTTGWQLIDYMPMSDITQPIEKSNRLFYFSAGTLLFMSFLAAYLLYAQVQVPLKRLLQSFQRLKNGDYSVRLPSKGKSEFSFLYNRFNSMVAQIQDLFEKVYLEKIHVREARLKQLQSQINPHFFYNCFSFISSMAKLKNNQAVVAMSQNLSQYYRYTTRQERDLVPLSEEMDFVSNYLEIHKLRMNRLDYRIEVPPQMKKMEIPPLVIQPLVENAVIHGIEARRDAGKIQITGECTDSLVRVIVEDDGKGMDEAEREALQKKLYHPMDENMGCGVWNVQQRMQLRYGEHAGLAFSASPLGGLRVELFWEISSEDV